MTDAAAFTCLFGDYEDLSEQPVATQSSLPFICFTDNPKLTSGTWQIHVVEPVLELDPARSSRHPKILAHHYLPGYRRSLYIDNSVRLLEPPEELLEVALPESGPPMALNAHSFHHTLNEEAAAIAEHGFEDPDRLTETITMLRDPRVDMLDARPLWGGMIARRHHDPMVVSTMETWWMLVLRYSRRDQLTLPLALRTHALAPGIVGLDNHASGFHEWPVHANRRVPAAPLRASGGRDMSAKRSMRAYRALMAKVGR